MTLTEIAIKRPSLIIVIFGVLTMGGLFCYNLLSYELLPDFSPPTITITTRYPGASPTEVKSNVSEVIEDALSELEGVDDMTSKSLENVSIVIVNFKFGTNLDLAMQDAQRKIDNIKRLLPEDVESPNMTKISPNDRPILQLSATSDLPDAVFYQKMIDEILPQLQQIKGVSLITLLGGEKREIRVNIDQDKLKYYGLSLLQVTAAVKAANLEFPAGKVKNRAEQVTVKLAGKFQSIDDLRNLVIITPAQGSPVRLRDVAEVNDGLRETVSVSRYNGKNGIGLNIKKQGDANAVEVSRLLRAKLAQLEKTGGKANYRFAIADDTSEFTLEAVEAVTHDLEIAVILVGAIMLLFLHSFRNALIVMLAIPASLVSVFVVMYALGYTLNLMTLLAMSLVVGILVDDSIVVLENIYRHLEMGKDSRTAAIDGRNEIGFTAAAITFVDVVVFFPITLVNTTIGDILRQFSIVVVSSTLMSLFVCFTLTPWLASRFSKLEHLNARNPLHWVLIQFEKLIDAYVRGYGKILRWTLNHKLITLLVVGVLFAGMVVVGQLGLLGQELVAAGDQGKILMRMEFDKTVPIPQNNITSRQIEQYLLTKPEVKAIFANIGGPTSDFGSVGVGEENKSELTIKLHPADKVARPITEKHMIALRDELEQRFTGVEFRVSSIGLGAGGPPIEIILNSENQEKLMATAQRLKQEIINTPGAFNTQMSVEDSNPEVRVEVDREKMARLGLNIQTVGATLRNAFLGDDDSEYREGDSDYDIRVMLDAFERSNPDDVRNISFMSAAQGRLVKLEEFANITRSMGPSVLERKDRRSSVTITAYALGRGSGTVAQDIDKKLKGGLLPAEVSYQWGGDIKRQNDSFASLGLALLSGIILVYLIMVALYDDFVYPFVVLFSIPVALIGAILALNLVMANFSIFTMLGIIMLLGLVAKNAILIVDFANHLKEQGYSTFDALMEAGKERQRPILMTTLAMIIGMMPIALASGAGSEWKNSLAWVLIGGLTSSMILTVFLVPVVYYLVDMAKVRIARLRGQVPSLHLRGTRPQEVVPSA